MAKAGDKADGVWQPKASEEESTTASENETVIEKIASNYSIQSANSGVEKVASTVIVPRDSWADEVWDILTVGGPMCAAGIGRCLQLMGLQTVLGNLDTTILASVAVAGIWTQVMETMLQSGMGQVVTLQSQAFGAKNYRLVATWCHITFVYVTIMAIPFTILRWFTTPVLLSIGVDPVIAENAGVFTIYAQSVLVFELWYHTFRTYFASQTIVLPDAFINFLFVGVWFLCAHVAVNVLDGGIIGAALAQATAWVLQAFAFIGFSFAMGYHKKTWYTPDWREIFVASRWRTLTGQLIPAAIAGLVEQLQLQALTLISAQIGATQSAAQTLCNTLNSLCFMFAVGTSGGTGIRVGRFLGEGRASAAKFTAWAGSTVVCAVNSFFGLMALILLPTYARIASTDPAVWALIDSARWVVACNITLLGSFAVIANVIMKQGRAHLVAMSVPVCTWFLGIPTSYYGAHHFGLFGIYMGASVGYGTAFFVLFIAFIRSDWETIAEQARQRAEADEQKKASNASLTRASNASLPQAD